MDECSKCGQPHIPIRGTRCCTGHKKPARGGGPCHNAPMAGQTVCHAHGGRAKQNKAAGKRRTERAAAEALALTLGNPVEGVDPGDIIAERIAARLGHVRWLHARVQVLEPDALIWGLTKRKTATASGDDSEDDDESHTRRRFAGTDEGDTQEAKPHIWYALYTEASDKLERLCIDAIRVGLDERRVKLAEQQADLWVRLIDGVLTELGHNPNDPATAEVVARHLEAVA